MIFNSLFTQLVIGGLAVAILIVYVQPALARIGETQEDIEKFRVEFDKISKVNAKLASFVSTANSMSDDDQRAMLAYMPDTDDVDNVSVSRDIFTISQLADVHVSSINSSDSNRNQASNETENPLAPTKHTFSVSLDGSYTNIKYFLSLLEQNDYPLDVYNMSISSSDEENLSTELEIVTYSHN